MSENKSRIFQISSSLAVASLAMISPTSCIAKLGIDMLSGLGKKYFQDAVHPTIKRLWASDKGMLNHHLQKVFKESIRSTCQAIEKKFLAQAESWQKKEMKTFMKELVQAIIDDFDQNAVEKSATKLSEFLSPSKGEEALLDEFSIRVTEEQRIAHYLPSNFEKDFRSLFATEFPLRFKEGIKNNELAKNTVDLLFQTEIFREINALHEKAEGSQMVIDEIRQKLFFCVDIYGDMLTRIDLKLDRIEKKLDAPNIIVREFQDYKNYEGAIKKTIAEIEQFENDLLELQTWASSEKDERKLSFFHSRIAGTEKAIIESKEQKAVMEADLQGFIEQVVQMAATFSKLEVKTERLTRAQNLFNSGLIKEANEVLKRDDLANDQARLIRQMESKRIEVAALEEQIKNNANEYAIKARLTELNYEDPNHLELAREYYLAALKILPSTGNHYEYAKYLNKIDDSEEAIRVFKEGIILAEKIYPGSDEEETYNYYVLLTGLSISYTFLDRQSEAEACLFKAIPLAKLLADTNPELFAEEYGHISTRLGIFYALAREFEKSSEHFHTAIQILSELSEKEQSIRATRELTIALINYADACYKESRLNDAFENYLRAKDLFEGLPSEHQQDIGQFAAKIYFSIGAYCQEKSLFQDAVEFYQAGVYWYDCTLNLDPDSFLQVYTSKICEIAEKFSEMKAMEQAESLWQKLVSVYEQFSKIDFEKHKRYLGFAFEQCYQFYEGWGKLQESREYYLKSIDIMIALAEQQADDYKPSLARLYFDYADLLKKMSLPKEELIYLLKSLHLFIDLAEKNRKAYLPDIADSYFSLFQVNSMLFQYKEALKNAKIAIALYAEIDPENGGLENGQLFFIDAHCAIAAEAVNRYDEAILYCDKAIQYARRIEYAGKEDIQAELCRMLTIKGFCLKLLSEGKREGDPFLQEAYYLAEHYPGNTICQNMLQLIKTEGNLDILTSGRI